MEQTQTVQEQTKQMSKGEKLFDWLVYGGLAGVGTFIVTIPIAFWAKYGKGAERFEGAVNWLQKKGLSEQRAEQFMNTTATMQGGNVMVLPVKWAEDNKVAIVTKLNDMMGEKTDAEQLEKAGEQTWGSILKARALAWITVFTGFEIAANTIGGKQFDKFEKGFSTMACNMLGKQTHVNGAETRAFKYGRIAALDVFATTAATILLYTGSRFFAHIKNKKPAAETEAKPEAAPKPLADTITEATQPNTPKHVQEIIREHGAGKDFVTSYRQQAEAANNLHIGA